MDIIQNSEMSNPNEMTPVLIHVFTSFQRPAIQPGVYILASL
jgi:hypothetical protein